MRFEAEIEKYNKLNNEIIDKKNFENLGWLRVKTKQIKNDLSGWASRWGYKFTKHLRTMCSINCKI